MKTFSKEAKLSERELQLINFAEEGLSNSEIATRLNISESAVCTRWLGVHLKVGPELRSLLPVSTQDVRQGLIQDIFERESVVPSDPVEELRHFDYSPLSGDWMLLEGAPSAVLIVTPKRLIALANQSAHNLFGYAAHAMQGLDLWSILPQRLRKSPGLHFDRYLEPDSDQLMDEGFLTIGLREDGSEFLIQAAVSSVDSLSGRVLTCFVGAV